jgi:hypothetical protein
VIFLVFQLIPITSVFPRLRPLTQQGGFGAAEIDNNLGEDGSPCAERWEAAREADSIQDIRRTVSCRFRHPLNPASNSS